MRQENALPNQHMYVLGDLGKGLGSIMLIRTLSDVAILVQSITGPGATSQSVC